MPTKLILRPVNQNPRSIAGIRWASACAGLYPKTSRLDMALLAADPGSQVCLRLTQNLFAAAPILHCRQSMKSHSSEEPTYLLINAGNANAGTGARGMDDAQALCQSLADSVRCPKAQILPFSTGVIGEYLPMPLLQQALANLSESLVDDKTSWAQAAKAILTTDTREKISTIDIIGDHDKVVASVTGIAKGSGMIHPDMATMLCFLATDARVDGPWFERHIDKACQNSFNCISVDGDTSTNDALCAIATQKSSTDFSQRAAQRVLAQAIALVMDDLARQIVDDGEGATVRFVVKVTGARSQLDARKVAQTVATSPLVKTALGARDPNWGRILAAIGRSGARHLLIDAVEVWLGETQIVANGHRYLHYTEEQGVRALATSPIEIRIDLHQGRQSAHYQSCDLSCEYVRINRDYRS